MVIWKFPLVMEGCNTVQMPVAAGVMSVHVQRPNPDLDGTICLWAICDPKAPLEDRHFAVVGTGRTMPPDLKKFIGTVPIGPVAWHVFECEQ